MDGKEFSWFLENKFSPFKSVDRIKDECDPHAKYAFVADFVGAFHNVILSQKARRMSCFPWEGKYICFNVLFFGSSIGPHCWNEYIQRRMKNEKCHRFIDDSFGLGREMKDYKAVFGEFCDNVIRNELKIAPEKLRFGKRVDVLGSIWQEGTFRMDINKLICLRYVCMIRSKVNLQQNLGVFRYIERYCPKLAIELDYYNQKANGNENWSWTKYDARRLIAIYLKIEHETTLHSVDWNREIILRSDGANGDGRGLGFSILQRGDDGKEKFILHHSRTLKREQKRYTPIEIEVYSVMLALEKFPQYFYHKKFRLEVDAKAMLGIFRNTQNEKPNRRIWKWVYILFQFNFRIVHIKGKDNTISDWLSRHPFDIEKFIEYILEINKGDEKEQVLSEKELESKKKEEKIKKILEEYNPEITKELEQKPELIKDTKEKVEIINKIEYTEENITTEEKTISQETKNEVKIEKTNVKEEKIRVIKRIDREESDKKGKDDERIIKIIRRGDRRIIINKRIISEEKEREEIIFKIDKSEKESKEIEGGDSYHTPAEVLKTALKIFGEEYILKDNLKNYWKKIKELKGDEEKIKDLIWKEIFNDPCPLKEVKLGSEDDALINDNKWKELNFCNPPYSEGLFYKFLEKAYEQAVDKGKNTILLCPFKYTIGMRNLVFSSPTPWSKLAILPSVSFGKKNKGRKIFPAMLLIVFDKNCRRLKDDNRFKTRIEESKIGRIWIMEKEYENIINKKILNPWAKEETIYQINGKDNEYQEIEHEASEEDELDDKEEDWNQYDYIVHNNDDLDNYIKDEPHIMGHPKIDGNEEIMDVFKIIIMSWLNNKELPTNIKEEDYKEDFRLARKHLKNMRMEYGRLVYISNDERSKKFNQGRRYYVDLKNRYQVYNVAHNKNGHQGIDKVMFRLNMYWWPNMKSIIERKIKTCEVCQKNRVYKKEERDIHTNPPYTEGEAAYLDLMGGKYEGKYKFLLVYTTAAEKYTILEPLKSKSGEDMATTLLNKVFYRIGFPHLIIHDPGKENLNKFVNAIRSVAGTACRVTTVDHSISNAVERTNRTIGDMIRRSIKRKGDKWHKEVKSWEFAMNTYCREGLYNSPYEALHFRKPTTLLDWVEPIPTVKEDRMNEMINNLKIMRER